MARILRPPSPPCRRKTPTRQTILRPVSRGFALIEALVAIVVLAVGVLGLVGLQGSMTRAQTASKLRADAAYLANELTGSIWADIANRAQYATGSCNAYARCKDWAAKVAAVLPAGTSAVTVDTATGDVTVSIGWTLPGGESHRFVTATTIVASST